MPSHDDIDDTLHSLKEGMSSVLISFWILQRVAHSVYGLLDHRASSTNTAVYGVGRVDHTTVTPQDHETDGTLTEVTKQRAVVGLWIPGSSDARSVDLLLRILRECIETTIPPDSSESGYNLIRFLCSWALLMGPGHFC